MAWSATITFIGEQANGVAHITARVNGDAESEALRGAECILKLLATGKKALIRARPEAVSETDFDTNETFHRGYVRFSMIDEPGEWTDCQSAPVKILALD